MSFSHSGSIHVVTKDARFKRFAGVRPKCSPQRHWIRGRKGVVKDEQEEKREGEESS